MAERVIPRGSSPLSQPPFNHRDIPFSQEAWRFPFCKEPMNTAVDPTVQITVMQWASAMAKTDGVVTNAMGHSIAEEPKNILTVMPKESRRDDFSRDVIERMIQATPALNRLFVEAKSRDAGRTIGFKRFAAGAMYLTSAGSAANFRGPRAAFIHCGEVDGYPLDADGEGDPVSLALKRAEGMAEAVRFIEGTGTFEKTQDEKGNVQYNSKIDEWMDRSDRRHWFVPCRSCGHMQVLRWHQIVHPRGQPEKAEILCDTCSCAHSDRQRLRMILQGEWRPTCHFSGIAGFWLNGINSTLPPEKGFRTKLHQFVVDAQRAEEGGRLTKRVWINTFLAELDKIEDMAEAPPPWKPIYDAREDYGTHERIVLPTKVKVLTCFTDVHDNRLEVEWRGWASNEESWGAAHVVIFGDIQQTDLFRKWTIELSRSFDREDGCKLRLNLALIDAGAGRQIDPIFAILRWLKLNPVDGVSGKIRMSKGMPGDKKPINSRKWETIAGRAKGIQIGTVAAKSLIYARLRLHGEPNAPADGFIHFGKNYSEEFIRQCVSESEVKSIVEGEEVTEFMNPLSNKNEGLDCLVGNLAAYRAADWNYEALEQEMQQLAHEARQPKPAETPRPRQQEALTSSFVGAGGWRI